MQFKYIVLCLFVFLGNLGKAAAQAAPDVWDVLRDQFTINHEETRPEVQAQIRWLTAHPSYLQKVCQEAEPFIYHIVEQIKAHNLPGELALLPMIESAYNPFAYSGAGAAGLWQIMPKTGTELGLKQDWWFDGRRGIRSSTEAALNHITSLKNHYNDNWMLAIAAYDAGEGTMDRAIKTSQSYDFWSLQVPAETRVYVPRFLALAEIIKNPDQYKVTIPAIPYLPYFEEVNIGSQIDLSHAAQLAGMTYKELIKLNPGYNRWATAPYQPFYLVIPVDKAQQFSQKVANVPAEKRVSWTKHQVQTGDTLTNIAGRYHTTTHLIKELNQLKTDQVTPNQTILIPSTNNTALFTQNMFDPRTAITTTGPRNHRLIHFVQANESYQTLEKLYKVKTKDIQTWNRLPQGIALKTGQQLVIWKQVQAPTAYTVKSGDSLSLIAQQKNTRVSTILALNPTLNPLRPLRAGQILLVG